MSKWTAKIKGETIAAGEREAKAEANECICIKFIWKYEEVNIYYNAEKANIKN